MERPKEFSELLCYSVGMASCWSAPLTPGFLEPLSIHLFSLERKMACGSYIKREKNQSVVEKLHIPVLLNMQAFKLLVYKRYSLNYHHVVINSHMDIIHRQVDRYIYTIFIQRYRFENLENTKHNKNNEKITLTVPSPENNNY